MPEDGKRSARRLDPTGEHLATLMLPPHVCSEAVSVLLQSPGEGIAVMLCAIERIVRDRVKPADFEFTIGAVAGALQILAARQRETT